MKCDGCKKDKPDVCERPNAYNREINDEPEAVWTACDDCAYENAMDV